ncbi:hypothetical protein EU528_11090 [Candidatus Thorarchaeota archaeon]|nr:MAG: hypothetical protein EU528_11090 [Candidatus Thorarchaeota archaeon]
MGKFYNQKLLGVCLLSILCLILLTPKPTMAQSENSDLTGVKVAVYNGSGEMDSSRIALIQMFEWMGASVEEVNASQILGDFLDDCDILVFPGGSENSYMIDLQYITGIEKIQDFVRNGGSYFGICGGSTFGAKTVNLFNGSMYPLSEPGDTIHMTTMAINQSSIGPDLSHCPATVSTMYYASKYFVPTTGFFVHTIATYNLSGRVGMIAFEYGYGTVFLSSPHPEYEENGDRDDTSVFDYLDDPDSEWDFLLQVSKWLVETSTEAPPSATTTASSTTTTTISTNTTTNTPLDLPLITTASASAVLAVLVVAILYRRAHA